MSILILNFNFNRIEFFKQFNTVENILIFIINIFKYQIIHLFLNAYIYDAVNIVFI